MHGGLIAYIINGHICVCIACAHRCDKLNWLLVDYEINFSTNRSMPGYYNYSGDGNHYRSPDQTRPWYTEAMQIYNADQIYYTKTMKTNKQTRASRANTLCKKENAIHLCIIELFFVVCKSVSVCIAPPTNHMRFNINHRLTDWWGWWRWWWYGLIHHHRRCSDVVFGCNVCGITAHSVSCIKIRQYNKHISKMKTRTKKYHHFKFIRAI